MELTIKDINALAKLVVSEKLDSLEYGSLKITKSKHEYPRQEKVNKPAFNTEEMLSGEELLYASTTAGPLTVEEIEAFSINPPNKRSKSKE